MSTLEYTQKFKRVAIRELLESLMPGHNASILFFTLATLALGDGGSVQMTRNIVQRFKSLGGKIQNNSSVQKILIDENKAKGILVNNRIVEADAIIVAKDTLSAADTLFEKHLQVVWIGEMQQNTKLMMNTFICLGIESNLSDFPKNLVFHLKEPIIIAGIKYSSLSLYNYAVYEDYAPKDCTSVTIAFIGDSYDFWKNAKERGDYHSEKEKLAKVVIDISTEKLPQTYSKISVYDIATPLTYERYCGTYKGSWMSIADKSSKIRVYPNKVDNIKNLYFASQRLQAIGGLPAAAESGRNAVESLCCDMNREFSKDCIIKH